MSIFAIDPGPDKSACVLWNQESDRVLFAQEIQSANVSALILEKRDESLNSKTGFIVACEHLQCFGMAVGRETFEAAYWIGEIRHCCFINGIRFHRIYRSDEKMHLCQSMRAKDKNIRQALIDQYGQVGTKKNKGPLFGIANDLWSALAVAVTCADELKHPSP